jgi:hypothetical protein
MNLLGYMLCLGALISEDWPKENVVCCSKQTDVFSEEQLTLVNETSE